MTFCDAFGGGAYFPLYTPDERQLKKRALHTIRRIRENDVILLCFDHRLPSWCETRRYATIIIIIIISSAAVWEKRVLMFVRDFFSISLLLWISVICRWCWVGRAQRADDIVCSWSVRDTRLAIGSHSSPVTLPFVARSPLFHHRRVRRTTVGM